MPTDTTTTTAALEGPRTATEHRIWDALSPQPQTTAHVVAAAGVGRSTASKTLARWAKAGLITRHDSDEDNTVTTWSHTPDQPESAAVVPDDPIPAQAPGDPDPVTPDGDASGAPLTPEADEPESDADGPERVEAAPVKPERLQPGGLYGLVEDYLREHPGEEFGPSQLGKALARSSGAVNNALEKMTNEGVAVKTQNSPKRFALAPDEEN